jgi:uncharacterized protein (TIGR03435 family)
MIDGWYCSEMFRRWLFEMAEGSKKKGVMKAKIFVLLACVIAYVSVRWTGMANALALSSINPQQCTSQTASNAKRGFEVASIKRSQGDRYAGYRILPDGFRSVGMPLHTVILIAYFPLSLWSDERIRAAPSWVANDPYDIEARVAPEDLAAWQSERQNFLHKEMLQNDLQQMLRERCRLVAHMVPVNVKGYELMVKDRGDRLSHSRAAVLTSSVERMSLPDGGVANFVGTDNSGDWSFSNTSIKDLMVFLSMQRSGVIVDRTGLTGRYNFELHGTGIDGPATGIAPSVIWDFAPLGLKLKTSVVQTTTLVIDHIQRPSSN